MQKLKGIIKKLMLLIVTAALSQACLLTKKGKEDFLFHNCKDSIVTIRKDTTIFKDSISYVFLDGPIQYLENPCKKLCDSLGNLKPFEIIKKKNGLKATIKSVGNSIAFDCDADSLRNVNKIITHELDVYRASAVTVKKPCELEHRTKWDGFTWYWFIITAGLLVLYILFKCLKTYLKAVPFVGTFIK